MNPEEFNTCVDLYTDIVYRFIRRYLPDNEMAKDILQDSFLKNVD
jgi:DNA-directed RNA polymerase specialized sigma24 family protein